MTATVIPLFVPKPQPDPAIPLYLAKPQPKPVIIPHKHMGRRARIKQDVCFNIFFWSVPDAHAGDVGKIVAMDKVMNGTIRYVVLFERWGKYYVCTYGYNDLEIFE